jgi:hypothetical protein
VKAHSVWGASSRKRWGSCPGSVKLCEGIPSTTSAYAAEGTQAHDLAESVLLGKAVSFPSDEMREAVAVYTDFVNELSDDDQSSRLIEHRFDLKSLHPGLFGTCDAIVFNRATGVLYVVDFKYGAGLAVEVLEGGKPNAQLSYYALGAALTCDFKPREIEIVIVQPRCPHPDGPIRRLAFDAVDLIDIAADILDEVERTKDPNAPLVAGEHCRFCPAAHICPELHKNALAIAQQEFTPAFSYDPAKLSQTLEWLPVLESWIKNVREFAYREAEHGRVPPGWKLVQKRATRRWTNEESVVDTLIGVDGLTGDDIYETKLKSPAQIEKLIGKREFQETLGPLTIAESSGYALAHESDKREPVRLDAAAAFKPTGD